MFSHLTPQRPSMDIIKTDKNNLPTMKKPHLSIAVGIALSCFAVQAQAAQTDDELPVSETALEYDNEGVAQSAVQPSMTANQQAKLFFDCSQVQTSAARLACFDKVAAEGATPSYVNNKQSVDLAKTLKTTISGNPQLVFVEENTMIANANDDASGLVAETITATETLDTIDPAQREAQVLEQVGVSQADIEKYTPLSLSYDLDKNSERGTWTVRPYRPTYILPLFYTFDPNLGPSTPSQPEEPYTSDDLRNTELKFQLSLKTKVAEDLFDTNADLWFGYTQESHWQVYNEDNSRPFRATDYQPEVFLTQPVTANLPFGGRLRMLGAGAVHHSNGQDDPLSRSWNRAYLMAGAEWGKLSVIPRLWTRVSNEKADEDDNPDIEDFMGYGDVKFLYDLADQKSISGTLRYNPSTNKGAAQLDYVYPLTENVNGYVQLFQGYSESLIDYNHENTSIGFGIVLNDWRGF